MDGVKFEFNDISFTFSRSNPVLLLLILE